MEIWVFKIFKLIQPKNKELREGKKSETTVFVHAIDL